MSWYESTLDVGRVPMPTTLGTEHTKSRREISGDRVVQADPERQG